MICFFDFETNSKDPMNAEMLTGYFEVWDGTEQVSHYYFKSQIDNWSVEAEAIHKISEAEMLTFPDKKKALYMLNNYLVNLSKDTTFVCFSNPNNFGQHMHFDKAVLEMNLMLANLPFKIGLIASVHTMAKTAYSMGLFDPIKSESGRASFSQINVYDALFDEKYDAHNAYEDVQAMIKLYFELVYMIDNRQANRHKKQLELF